MSERAIPCLVFLILVLSDVAVVMCQTGISNSEEQEILDAHNRLRGMVSPTAANMERMVWNDELTLLAQNYSEACIFEHNADRVAQQSTFSSVGENLAASTGDADYVGFVQLWYNEVADYNYENNSCNPGAVCGHYTQRQCCRCKFLHVRSSYCSNCTRDLPFCIDNTCSLTEESSSMSATTTSNGLSLISSSESLLFVMMISAFYSSTILV